MLRPTSDIHIAEGTPLFASANRNYKETTPLSMFIRFNALVRTEIESRYPPGIKNRFIIILKRANNRYQKF